LSNFIPDRKIANAIQGIINTSTCYDVNKRPSATELINEIRTTLDFCKKETGVPTNLRDSLEKLKFTLSGSQTLAAAQIKQQEFDALFKEMDDAQQMLIDAARKYIPPIEKIVRDRGAGAVFVGGLDRTTTGDNTVTVIIVYEPQSLRTKIHRVTYEFIFGLNSSNEFVWIENFQHDGQKINKVFFNPRSLAVVAGQKAGQIESILQNTFIPKLTELLQ
jgi:hypothetical protein